MLPPTQLLATSVSLRKFGSMQVFCFIFNKFIYYFWLHWVFVAAHRLSLVAASRGYSSLRGLLIVVASLVAELGL